VFLLPGAALLLFQVPWGLRNAHLYRQSTGDGLGFFWSMMGIGLGLGLTAFGILLWVGHARGTADARRQRRLAAVVALLALVAIPAGLYAGSLGGGCFAGCGPWFSRTPEVATRTFPLFGIEPLEPLSAGTLDGVQEVIVETVPPVDGLPGPSPQPQAEATPAGPGTMSDLPRYFPTEHVTGPGAPSPMPHEALEDAVPGARLVSSIASGHLAWIAAPTDIHQGGVFGDLVEGTQVRVVDPATGESGPWTTPAGTVLEDRRPRFADVDGDGREELLVVLTDLGRGASVAILDVHLPVTELRARTTPVGAGRWLNTLPPVDVDADGDDEIAYVEDPHLGGDLVIQDLVEGELREVARGSGFSNHVVGSPEQDLALAFEDRTGRVAWLLPESGREHLALVDAHNPTQRLTQFSLPRPALGPIHISPS
jgi:hypothetical protein